MKALGAALWAVVSVAALGAALFLLGALRESGELRSARLAAERERLAAGKIAGSLLVWLDNDDWARAVITAFNTRYPDVKIIYEKVGNVDSRGKVSLDGPAGIGPDVFLMPHDHIGNAIIDDICLPFEREAQERYAGLLLESSVKTCTFDGDLYALPISTENLAFFYNKDLLAGQPPPKSFEDIFAFAKKWNNPQANKYALRWQVDDSYHNYFFLAAAGMRLFGENMDDYKEPGFDSPEARAGVEFHTSIRAYFNVNTSDATWDSTVAAFQRGEVPFTITGPWAIGDAKKNGVNFGITKLPAIRGVQPRCFSGNIVAAVSSYTKNPEAARAFTDFLVSVEGAAIQFEVTGKLAAFKDVGGVPGLRDDAHLAGVMEQAPFTDPMPVIPEVYQMWDAMKALFTFTWDGQLSAEAAQQKAMDTYDTALLMAGKSRSWAD
ncbi:MAG: maltose ABC transporter substrate-binding protein [Spirochaetaceae bacterium]|jgi:arabinogalactan oligomer/maltooligosaccharide transport system substrate-binding protein|nr:maltose ABC transporter substrate-binding protein [Spirochaetaceae bacterium]